MSAFSRCRRKLDPPYVADKESYQIEESEDEEVRQHVIRIGFPSFSIETADIGHACLREFV